MRRIPLWIAPLMLAAASMTTTGCADKQRIEALEGENQQLQARNQSLQSELDQCQSRQAQLLADLSAKNGQLVMKDSTIADLRAQLAAKPAPGPTSAGGWEKGVAGDRVTVGSDILFSSGKADLTAKGKSVLDPIIRELKGTYGGMPVLVYGYTDSDPIRKSKWKDNLELSCARSSAVTRYLEEQGIDSDRIHTVGRGEESPVAPNTTAAGKQQNRRVEIIVLK